MGEARKEALPVGFDASIRLEYHGAKIVHHARRVVFQLAEVAIPRTLFAAILRRIERLRRVTPAPT